MRFVFIVCLFSITILSAQTSYIKEYGPTDLRANEAPINLLEDTSFVTAIYLEEGGAGGEEQLVFSRFDRETGTPQESFQTAFPYISNSLSSVATDDGALVAAYVLSDDRVVISKYQNNAILLATDTLSFPGLLTQLPLLKVTKDGKIVLAAILADEVVFWRYTSNLDAERTFEYEDGGSNFQDFIVLPDDNILTFQSATNGDGFAAIVIDAQSGVLIADNVLQGSAGLLTYGLARFVQHPENNEISLVLGRFISQETPLQPVIYSFNTEGVPNRTYDLAPIEGRNQIFLQGVSPQGHLVWLLRGVGLFAHRDYRQSGDNLTTLTAVPQFNGQPINGISHIVSTDEIYFLSTGIINSNDRDIILSSTNLTGMKWQQRFGRSSGLTHDRAISSTSDPLGNFYLLSASPTPDLREIVTTVLKTNTLGDTVWVKRFRGPEGEPTTPHMLTYRGDGLLFVQHYSSEVSFQDIIGPQGDQRYPQTAESLENAILQNNQYDALPVGGGQVLTFRVNGRIAILDVYRADGSRRYSVVLPSLSNPRGAARLEDNSVLLMGRSLDGTDRLHIVKFDLNSRQEIWSRNLGTNSNSGAADFVRNSLLLSNGDYVLLASTYPFSEPAPPAGLNLYRITPNGGIGTPVFFEQPIPYPELTVPLYLTNNDELIVTSVTDDGNTGVLRSLRVDSDDFSRLGVVDVAIPYENYFPSNITLTRNGYISLYGQTSIFDTQSAQLFVLSTRANPEPTAITPPRSFSGQVRLYPNPAIGPQTLTIELPVPTSLDLQFFDTSGRLLSNQRLPPATTHQRLLDATTAPAAATFLQIIDPSGASQSLRLFRLR